MVPARLHDDEPDMDAASLENALTALAKSAQIHAKQREGKITKLVDNVCNIAYDHGLSGSHLEELIDILTLPNHLDQASFGALIRSLYPATKVQDSVVVKVATSLGHGEAKIAYSAQAALLKWLVMVYDVMEDPKVLSRLYNFLFNLLDTIAIRASLCHLLSLITRRKHVRPFRIQMLLELARRVGNEPPVVGLIRVYKDYYPDVIVGEVASSRASVFTVHPNIEWKQKLSEIQRTYAQKSQDSLPRHQQAFKVVRRGLGGAKRSKSSVIPEVHTSRAQESSTTLEEIDNAKDFVENLEKIELPNQLVAVMGDPLLQKLIQLKSDETTMHRVDNWLMAFFEDQLAGGAQSQNTLLDMLDSIRDYTTFTKRLPTACTRYLQSLLLDWNGLTGRNVILDLLSYLPISPFNELYESFFQNLEYAILDDTPASQTALLIFYTHLLRQWTVCLLTNPDQAIASTAITDLITHVSTLALNLLQITPNAPNHDEILTFYETTASLITIPVLQPYVRINTPPASLIYTLHFSSSLTALSRTCAILALYKRAFEVAMTRPPPKPTDPNTTPATQERWKEPYARDYVNHFNGFLMDICNCLWRSRAFNSSDPNALGCLLPAPVLRSLTTYISTLDKTLTVPSLFSLSYSPVLCSLAIACVRDLEDKALDDAGEENSENGISLRHAGPVTQKSLQLLESTGGLKLSWTDYRLGVLKSLEGKGISGVGSLMYNTMKHLMNARQSGKA